MDSINAGLNFGYVSILAVCVGLVLFFSVWLDNKSAQRNRRRHALELLAEDLGTLNAAHSGGYVNKSHIDDVIDSYHYALPYLLPEKP